MNHPDWQLLAEKAALYLYPRRCPFCGAVLGRDAVQGTVCPACLCICRPACRRPNKPFTP